MKKVFTLGNIIASAFMIYIGYNLLFIHERKEFLPKYVTIGLGIFILFIAIGGVIARIINAAKSKNGN